MQMVESEHGLLTTIAWQLGAQAPVQHALEGSVAIAGAGITWLRDRMGLIQSAADSEAVASSVPNTAGVPPPFLCARYSCCARPHPFPLPPPGLGRIRLPGLGVPVQQFPKRYPPRRLCQHHLAADCVGLIRSAGDGGAAAPSVPNTAGIGGPPPPPPSISHQGYPYLNPSLAP